MKVLLTGGTGFVGMNIAEKLADEGIEVVAYALAPFPKMREASFRNRKGEVHVVLGDILDTESLVRAMCAYGVDAVVHAAAMTPNAGRERRQTESIVDVNVMGTIAALEAAKACNVDKFIYLSSVEAYGKTAYEADELFEDSSVPKPNSLYQISKFAAERIALRYKQLFGCSVAAARIGEVFGAWEHDTGVRDTLSAPFQATQLALLGMKAWLPGSGRKTWVYGKDVAGGIYALLTADALRYDVYNVGSDFVWSIEEWCELLSGRYRDFSYELAAEAGKANVDFHTERGHAPLRIDRLEADTGFVPRFDLAKAFADYTEWLDRCVVPAPKLYS